jgi:hypothetical protein
MATWIPPVANAARAATFRDRVFTAGDTFPGRPWHEFTRRQLNQELQQAGFEPIAFWRLGIFGAAVGIKPTQTVSATTDK